MDLTFHESDERLELYALDRLSDSDVICIEEHLIVCDLCRERLDETAGFALAIREELRNKPLPRQEWWARRLAWPKFAMPRPAFALAGAMALALVCSFALRFGKAPLPPLATLRLSAMRGSDFKTVAATRELDVVFGDALPTAGFVVEVVDAGGAPVWQGAPQVEKNAARSGTVWIKIAKELKPGEYYARLYDSPGHQLHEYGFRVK